MKKNYWLILGFLALAFLVLAACGPKSVTVDLQLQEYKFIPDTIEVPAGSEVTVNLSNKGTLDHEMVIMVLGSEATVPFDEDDEPNVFWEHELAPGTQETVTFTAPTEPGTYQLVCGIPAHFEQGMKGTLIVK